MGRFRRTMDGTDGYPFRFNKEEISADIQLMNDLFEGGVRLYGNDIIYIRQEYLNVEDTFGEHLTKILDKSTPMMAFIEDTEGWGGEGDMFSKFGLRNIEDMKMQIPKNMFHDLGWYPRVGDLIYTPVAKALWEIESVHDDKDNTFRPLGQYVSYIIGCKSYLYDHVEASEELLASEDQHIETSTKVLFGDGSETDNAVVVDVTEKNDPIEQAKQGVVDDSEDDPLGF